MPVVFIASLIVVGGALTCRPAWYQPVSIDYNLLESDKHTHARIENDISAALNSSEPIELEFDESSVNRWIAARNELWPGRAPSLDPFQQPQIRFLDGNRVRLGALVEQAGVKVVLSATFRVAAHGDAVAVTWDSVHAGALPTPGRLIEEAAEQLSEGLRLGDGALEGDTLTLPNEWTWPNGKRRFHVKHITIGDGILRVGLEPL